MKHMHMHRQSAFSLFELVVSLALIVILVTTLFTIFSAGMGVYRTYDRGLSPYEQARTLFTLIERDIISIIPSEVGGTNSELLQGLNNRMTFMINDPLSLKPLAVRYLFNTTQNTFERQLAEPTSTQTLPVVYPTVDTIADHIDSVSFTYYGGQFSGYHFTAHDTQWPSGSVSAIDAPSEMPKGILITVTITDTKDASIQETFSRMFVIHNR